MRLKYWFIALITIAAFFLLVKIEPAQAADVSCNGAEVVINPGNSCPIFTLGGIRGSYKARNVPGGGASSYHLTFNGAATGNFGSFSDFFSVCVRTNIFPSSGTHRFHVDGPSPMRVMGFTTGNCLPPGPDLVPRDLKINQPPPYRVGQTINFSARVRNIGTLPAGSSHGRFRLDIGGDGTYDRDLGKFAFGPLAAGASSGTVNSTSWTITASGKKHILQWCVDVDNQVKETNENNNCDTVDIAYGGGSLGCAVSANSITLNYNFAGDTRQAHIYRNGNLITDPKKPLRSSPGTYPDPGNPLPPGNYKYDLRDAQAPYALLATATCTIAAAPSRFPFLTTSSGDIHAGGGVGYGVECVSTNGKILGSSASTVEYIASAGGDITSFASPISFGKSGSSAGSYGLVCRPPLNLAAEDYIDRNPTVPCFAVACVTASLQNGNQDQLVVWRGGSPLVLPALTIRARKTLYIPSGNLILNGPITYLNQLFTRANLPSFGLITNGGINISGSVPRVDGLIWSAGEINTCNEGIGTAPCRSSLVINGMMMANRFQFQRTGPSGATGNVEAERVGGSQFGLLFLATPPAFTDYISPKVTGPAAESEKPPLF